MHFVYIDDSKDNKLACYSALLVRWLGTLTTKPRFYAIHGDRAAAEVFCTLVSERLGFTASAGERGATVTL